MHKLIITAHPSTKGFTHAIAEKYEQGSLDAGHTVEVLDLYKEDYQQPYLKFENIREIKPDPERKRMQKKIQSADELVFIHPLWWVGPPAVMKNFIDTNFSSGFAYKYVKAPIIKGRPVGLLIGKQARIFITCDGANWMYKLVLTPFKFNWKYFILRLCGVKVKSFTLFDRMHWRSDEEKKRCLVKVYKMARKKE